MSYCASCGAQLSGRYCAICGAPAPAEPPAAQQVPIYDPQAAPPPPPPPPNANTSYPPPPQPAASAAAASDIPENVVCALTYAMGALTGVLFLVLEPYSKNPTVKFHAFQSIFVSVAVFVLWFMLLIFTGLMALIPFVGLPLGGALLGLFGLGWFALWIVLMMKAYQGERWKVPFLGDFAEKQAYTN
jgi:uncharacterized membrane protein